MATSTRPYVVTDDKTGEITVVEKAMTPAQALRAANADRFTVKPANAQQLLDLLKRPNVRFVTCQPDLPLEAGEAHETIDQPAPKAPIDHIPV